MSAGVYVAVRGDEYHGMRKRTLKILTGTGSPMSFGSEILIYALFDRIFEPFTESGLPSQQGNSISEVGGNGSPRGRVRPWRLSTKVKIQGIKQCTS